MIKTAARLWNPRLGRRILIAERKKSEW